MIGNNGIAPDPEAKKNLLLAYDQIILNKTREAKREKGFYLDNDLINKLTADAGTAFMAYRDANGQPIDQQLEEQILRLFQSVIEAIAVLKALPKDDEFHRNTQDIKINGKRFLLLSKIEKSL